MRTLRIAVDPHHPEPLDIQKAAAVLVGGGLVAFPTETVYGLGADALRPEAAERIFAAKGRPAVNPLIVHVLDTDQARALVTNWPERAQSLAERFWPGPLTLVLPKSRLVPDVVTAGGPTVAVRVPAHPVARALLAAAERPVAAPSANRSTRVSATSADHVEEALAGRIEMIVDGGPTPGGLESTVLDLTGEVPRILRPGLINILELEAALGMPLGAAPATAESGGALPSPGMLDRHYAPRVPLVLGGGDGWDEVQTALAAGKRVGWLALGVPRAAVPRDVMLIWLPEDVSQYSARLYAALHAFEASGVEQIVAALPPAGPEWLAVQDRLRRAAH